MLLREFIFIFIFVFHVESFVDFLLFVIACFVLLLPEFPDHCHHWFHFQLVNAIFESHYHFRIVAR